MQTVDTSHHLTLYTRRGRIQNGIVLDTMEDGVECWDRNVKRYVEFNHIQTYHSLNQYPMKRQGQDNRTNRKGFQQRRVDTLLPPRDIHGGTCQQQF